MASLLFVCSVFALGVLLVVTVQAQSATTNSTNPSPKTDPSEARALNDMFFRWGISADYGWNISGELCSGTAIDETENSTINPSIRCDCSYSGNTTCHITALRVAGLRVTGFMPEELWNWTYLTILDFRDNLLTGPISASISNLIRLQHLDLRANILTGPIPASISNLSSLLRFVAENALSGELPAELGLLPNLTVLFLRGNNFSGPLPWELGNLTSLQIIGFDSSGVSGPIPPTFANLRSLVFLHASDNELTGRIPQFIGNWSQLRFLEFHGNSFQGPIPSSFIGLTSLETLRISDLSNNEALSLDFLRNMSSLDTLSLRNNNISGAIPSFLSEFQRLQILDLSFNSLTGIIPDLLLNLTSLRTLFLGNNMLTGTVPAQKEPSLLTIDLSYNELSGSLPSWTREPNLQLNLVANNFSANNSDNSSLPSGLNCLQRNFPCHQVQPIYTSFAINCGGPEIRSSDGVVFETDYRFGPATYYVISTRRWAVSNVGFPFDRNPEVYQSSSSSQFSNTLDSELFQTARISAGSLRYYGLGLVNGNYDVTLQFAEMEINVSSTARRVFDIYIQGNLEVRDFDIRREAGGMSFRAVVREFKAQVRDNYLEIHLFWAGKGTCCQPTGGTYGPSISAVSAKQDSIPTVENNATSSNKNQNGLIVGIVVAVGATCLFSLLALCYVYQRRKRQRNFEDEELLGIDARPYTYTYAELKAATHDFHPTNKLGEGGFGPVYKGTLADGRLVAVKKLSVASHHGKIQFMAEIATISAVQHRNLVKLYGCCIEGVKRLLVYEYLENKSLDQLLFGIGNSSLYLDWPRRYDICLGVARGLAYLHEESRVRIVHRDVKASNILLDSDFTPKISDFGLAKLYDDKKTHISTKVAGTRGYLAPEYAMLGHLTEKADIFSFGVVALELISGRPNSDLNLEDDKIYLLEWAWNLHEKEMQIKLVDLTLCEFDEVIVKRIISIGLLCTQASPRLRPSMSRVVGMLSGDIEVPCVTSRPGYLTDWRFADETFMNEIGNSNPNPDDGIDMSTGTTMVAEDPDISLIHEGR